MTSDMRYGETETSNSDMKNKIQFEKAIWKRDKSFIIKHELEIFRENLGKVDRV